MLEKNARVKTPREKQKYNYIESVEWHLSESHLSRPTNGRADTSFGQTSERMTGSIRRFDSKPQMLLALRKMLFYISLAKQPSLP